MSTVNEKLRNNNLLENSRMFSMFQTQMQTENTPSFFSNSPIISNKTNFKKPYKERGEKSNNNNHNKRKSRIIRNVKEEEEFEVAVEVEVNKENK